MTNAAPAMLTLTKLEREIVEWAFGAMDDYWGADCAQDHEPIAESEGVAENDLTIPDAATMPYLAGNTLVLSTWNEINDDLRYRVAEQLPDMADDSASEGGGLSPRWRRPRPWPGLKSRLRQPQINPRSDDMSESVADSAREPLDGRLEVGPKGPVASADYALTSIAISLKRIADTLDGTASGLCVTQTIFGGRETR